MVGASRAVEGMDRQTLPGREWIDSPEPIKEQKYLGVVFLDLVAKAKEKEKLDSCPVGMKF